MFKPRLNGLHLVQHFLAKNGYNLQRIERIPSLAYSENDDEEEYFDEDFHIADGSEVYETGSALDGKDLDEELIEIMLVDEHRTRSIKFRDPHRSDGRRFGRTMVGGIRCSVEPEGDDEFVSFVRRNIDRIQRMASQPSKRMLSNLTSFAKKLSAKG